MQLIKARLKYEKCICCSDDESRMIRVHDVRIPMCIFNKIDTKLWTSEKTHKDKNVNGLNIHTEALRLINNTCMIRSQIERVGDENGFSPLLFPVPIDILSLAGVGCDSDIILAARKLCTKYQVDILLTPVYLTYLPILHGLAFLDHFVRNLKIILNSVPPPPPNSPKLLLDRLTVLQRVTLDVPNAMGDSSDTAISVGVVIVSLLLKSTTLATVAYTTLVASHLKGTIEVVNKNTTNIEATSSNIYNSIDTINNYKSIGPLNGIRLTSLPYISDISGATTFKQTDDINKNNEFSVDPVTNHAPSNTIRHHPIGPSSHVPNIASLLPPPQKIPPPPSLANSTPATPSLSPWGVPLLPCLHCTMKDLFAPLSLAAGEPQTTSINPNINNLAGAQYAAAKDVHTNLILTPGGGSQCHHLPLFSPFSILTNIKSDNSNKNITSSLTCHKEQLGTVMTSSGVLKIQWSNRAPSFPSVHDNKLLSTFNSLKSSNFDNKMRNFQASDTNNPIFSKESNKYSQHDFSVRNLFSITPPLAPLVTLPVIPLALLNKNYIAPLSNAKAQGVSILDDTTKICPLVAVVQTIINADDNLKGSMGARSQRENVGRTRGEHWEDIHNNNNSLNYGVLNSNSFVILNEYASNETQTEIFNNHNNNNTFNNTSSTLNILSSHSNRAIKPNSPSKESNYNDKQKDQASYIQTEGQTSPHPNFLFKPDSDSQSHLPPQKILLSHALSALVGANVQAASIFLQKLSQNLSQNPLPEPPNMNGSLKSDNFQPNGLEQNSPNTYHQQSTDNNTSSISPSTLLLMAAPLYDSMRFSTATAALSQVSAFTLSHVPLLAFPQHPPLSFRHTSASTPPPAVKSDSGVSKRDKKSTSTMGGTLTFGVEEERFSLNGTKSNNKNIINNANKYQNSHHPNSNSCYNINIDNVGVVDNSKPVWQVILQSLEALMQRHYANPAEIQQSNYNHLGVDALGMSTRQLSNVQFDASSASALDTGPAAANHASPSASASSFAVSIPLPSISHLLLVPPSLPSSYLPSTPHLPGPLQTGDNSAASATANLSSSNLFKQHQNLRPTIASPLSFPNPQLSPSQANGNPTAPGAHLSKRSAIAPSPSVPNVPDSIYLSPHIVICPPSRIFSPRLPHDLASLSVAFSSSVSSCCCHHQLMSSTLPSSNSQISPFSIRRKPPRKKSKIKNYLTRAWSSSSPESSSSSTASITDQQLNQSASPGVSPTCHLCVSRNSDDLSNLTSLPPIIPPLLLPPTAPLTSPRTLLSLPPPPGGCALLVLLLGLIIELGPSIPGLAEDVFTFLKRTRLVTQVRTVNSMREKTFKEISAFVEKENKNQQNNKTPHPRIFAPREPVTYLKVDSSLPKVPHPPPTIRILSAAEEIKNNQGIIRGIAAQSLSSNDSAARGSGLNKQEVLSGAKLSPQLLPAQKKDFYYFIKRVFCCKKNLNQHVLNEKVSSPRQSPLNNSLKRVHNLNNENSVSPHRNQDSVTFLRDETSVREMLEVYGRQKRHQQHQDLINKRREEMSVNSSLLILDDFNNPSSNSYSQQPYNSEQSELFQEFGIFDIMSNNYIHGGATSSYLKSNVGFSSFLKENIIRSLKFGADPSSPSSFPNNNNNNNNTPSLPRPCASLQETLLHECASHLTLYLQNQLTRVNNNNQANFKSFIQLNSKMNPIDIIKSIATNSYLPDAFKSSKLFALFFDESLKSFLDFLHFNDSIIPYEMKNQSSITEAKIQKNKKLKSTFTSTNAPRGWPVGFQCVLKRRPDDLEELTLFEEVKALMKLSAHDKGSSAGKPEKTKNSHHSSNAYESSSSSSSTVNTPYREAFRASKYGHLARVPFHNVYGARGEIPFYNRSAVTSLLLQENKLTSVNNNSNDRTIQRGKNISSKKQALKSNSNNFKSPSAMEDSKARNNTAITLSSEGPVFLFAVNPNSLELTPVEVKDQESSTQMLSQSNLDSENGETTATPIKYDEQNNENVLDESNDKFPHMRNSTANSVSGFNVVVRGGGMSSDTNGPAAVNNSLAKISDPLSDRDILVSAFSSTNLIVGDNNNNNNNNVQKPSLNQNIRFVTEDKDSDTSQGLVAKKGVPKRSFWESRGVAGSRSNTKTKNEAGVDNKNKTTMKKSDTKIESDSKFTEKRKRKSNLSKQPISAFNEMYPAIIHMIPTFFCSADLTIITEELFTSLKVIDALLTELFSIEIYPDLASLITKTDIPQFADLLASKLLSINQQVSCAVNILSKSFNHVTVNPNSLSSSPNNNNPAHDLSQPATAAVNSPSRNVEQAVHQNSSLSCLSTLSTSLANPPVILVDPHLLFPSYRHPIPLSQANIALKTLKDVILTATASNKAGVVHRLLDRTAQVILLSHPQVSLPSIPANGAISDNKSTRAVSGGPAKNGLQLIRSTSANLVPQKSSRQESLLRQLGGVVGLACADEPLVIVVFEQSEQAALVVKEEAISLLKQGRLKKLMDHSEIVQQEEKKHIEEGKIGRNKNKDGLNKNTKNEEISHKKTDKNENLDGTKIFGSISSIASSFFNDAAKGRNSKSFPSAPQKASSSSTSSSDVSSWGDDEDLTSLESFSDDEFSSFDSSDDDEATISTLKNRIDSALRAKLRTTKKPSNTIISPNENDSKSPKPSVPHSKLLSEEQDAVQLISLYSVPIVNFKFHKWLRHYRIKLGRRILQKNSSFALLKAHAKHSASRHQQREAFVIIQKWRWQRPYPSICLEDPNFQIESENEAGHRSRRRSTKPGETSSADLSTSHGSEVISNYSDQRALGGALGLNRAVSLQRLTSAAAQKSKWLFGDSDGSDVDIEVALKMKPENVLSSRAEVRLRILQKKGISPEEFEKKLKKRNMKRKKRLQIETLMQSVKTASLKNKSADKESGFGDSDQEVVAVSMNSLMMNHNKSPKALSTNMKPNIKSPQIFGRAFQGRLRKNNNSGTQSGSASNSRSSSPIHEDFNQSPVNPVPQFNFALEKIDDEDEDDDISTLVSDSGTEMEFSEDENDNEGIQPELSDVDGHDNAYNLCAMPTSYIDLNRITSCEYDDAFFEEFAPTPMHNTRRKWTLASAANSVTGGSDSLKNEIRTRAIVRDVRDLNSVVNFFSESRVKNPKNIETQNDHRRPYYEVLDSGGGKLNIVCPLTTGSGLTGGNFSTEDSEGGADIDKNEAEQNQKLFDALLMRKVDGEDIKRDECNEGWKKTRRRTIYTEAFEGYGEGGARSGWKKKKDLEMRLGGNEMKFARGKSNGNKILVDAARDKQVSGNSNSNDLDVNNLSHAGKYCDRASSNKGSSASVSVTKTTSQTTNGLSPNSAPQLRQLINMTGLGGLSFSMNGHNGLKLSVFISEDGRIIANSEAFQGVLGEGKEFDAENNEQEKKSPKENVWMTTNSSELDNKNNVSILLPVDDTLKNDFLKGGLMQPDIHHPAVGWDNTGWENARKQIMIIHEGSDEDNDI